MTVLIGASGSGKSTLLRCINQLELIDDRLVLFDGVDLADPRYDGDDIRQRIGIVFQAFNLFPHMSVLDNVTLAMRRVHEAAGCSERAIASQGRPGTGRSSHVPHRLPPRGHCVRPISRADWGSSTERLRPRKGGHEQRERPGAAVAP